jgi:hypothetical protein
MLLYYTFHLKQDEAVQFAAWSQTNTKVWVDGVAAIALEPDAVCARRPGEGAPSFHRGGHGHFAVNGKLKAGKHELVVAWEWPQFQADLVVGVADVESKEWLPFALLREQQ